MKRNNSEVSYEIVNNNNKSIWYNSNHEQSSLFFTNYFDFQQLNNKKEERSSSVKKNSDKLFTDGKQNIGKNHQSYYKVKCELIIGKWSYLCQASLKQYQLIFKLDETNENFLSFEGDYYKIPFNAIAQINKTQYIQNQLNIEILTKDYRKYEIKLSSFDHSFINALIESSFHINDVAYFEYAKWFFKYSFLPQLKKKHTINKKNGWDIYNIEEEFIRQCINYNQTNSRYRLFSNTNYKYCGTYPKKLMVPSNMADKDIEECSKFRTKGRLPALTYQYKNNRCIWRSSQSKGGLLSQKNDQDVILLTSITESSKRLMLYDARPYLNAFANQLQGNGFENVYHYPKIKMEIVFCYINNIHAIKASLSKLFNALQSDNKIFTQIDNSLWYEYITLIIKTSFEICKSIKNDCTVLIHCSDGWDRTTQLSSTSQLILDSYYRTLIGFIVLIEKDWISFGHQFALRNGNCIKNEDQNSPIFLQWLDTVYQLMMQNYTKFEFNAELLTFLAIELYNGKYGTFLFNSEQEREIYKAKETTVSIWTYVINNRHLFLNSTYNNEENLFSENLYFQLKKVRLWEEYFFNYEGKSVTKSIIEKMTEKDKEIDDYKKALAEVYNCIKGQKKIKKHFSNETMRVLNNVKEDTGLSSYVVIDNKKALNRDMSIKDNLITIKDEKLVHNMITVKDNNEKQNEIFDIIDSYV